MTTKARLHPSLLALTLALSLSGCASLLATSSGEQPIGVRPGERTLSQRIEDISIENAAAANMLKGDPAFRDANVDVVSFHSTVLLIGQVSSEPLKHKAEQTVRNIAEVKQVYNELQVGPSTYYLSRANDSVISTRIRSNLLFKEGFPSNRVRVTTVNGAVYLLGKLTTAEAEQAVEIVSATPGVQRIVKILDYLPDTPSAGNDKGA